MSALYRRWIVANGWAEAAGLGTTFIIGIFVAPMLSQSPDVLTVLAGALAAVLVGTTLEGIVVGVAQEKVLRRDLTGLRPRTWIGATAAGAGLAWVIGMVPSTVMALNQPQSASGTPQQLSPILQYTLASLLGFVVGPILGSAQWAVLRHHVRGASRWLLANSLAWALGMPLVFLGMDHVPWGGHPVMMVLSIYALCGAAGLAVGAIHGRILVQLLRQQSVVSAIGAKS